MNSVAPAVCIRPATVDDALAISRVHVRTWLSTYRGIVADSFLDALDPLTREPRWRDLLARAAAEGRMVFVAELAGSPGEIVGFASCGPQRDDLVLDGVTYDIEIYALYLTPECQRQGIGRRLVGVAADWLVEHGGRSIVIWALEKNGPARAFYEALGGVLSAQKVISIGPSELVDVAHCWPDARTLVSRARGASA